MHVRLRANRKGVDNLCNCIQSLCPSLSLSVRLSIELLYTFRSYPMHELDYSMLV